MAEGRYRDRLGRLVQGTADDADDHGVDVDAPRTGHDALAVADDLLARGFPFAAHEVLESRWKNSPQDERGFWQGATQVCVAITHQQRGNAVGADRLRRRAHAHLAASSSEDTAARYSFNLESVLNWLKEPTTPEPILTKPPAVSQ